MDGSMEFMIWIFWAFSSGFCEIKRYPLLVDQLSYVHKVKIDRSKASHTLSTFSCSLIKRLDYCINCKTISCRTDCTT